MELWAPWAGGRGPCWWQGVGPRWSLRSLPTLTIPWFYSMIPWFREPDPNSGELKYDSLSALSLQIKILRRLYSAWMSEGFRQATLTWFVSSTAAPSSVFHACWNGHESGAGQDGLPEGCVGSRRWPQEHLLRFHRKGLRRWYCEPSSYGRSADFWRKWI